MTDFSNLCHVAVNYVSAFPSEDQHRVLFLWGEPSVDKSRPLHELLGKKELEFAILPESDAWCEDSFSTTLKLLSQVFQIERYDLNKDQGAGFIVCQNEEKHTFGINLVRKRMTNKGFFLEDSFGRVNNGRQWLKVKVFIHTFQRPKRMFKSLKDAL